MENNKAIIIDAMGGDYAPLNVLEGVELALQEKPNLNLSLIGKAEDLKSIIEKNNLILKKDLIIDAKDVVAMNDSPANVIKEKPESSIVKGLELVAQKKFGAFVSAGNTGAVMSAATLILGRIKGISRPTIGTLLPCEKGYTTVFDVGANVDSKPQYLYEYALMGSIYVKEILGINNPKVGLLSIGEEREKGNQLSKAAYEVLENSQLNFIGNVEGRDIPAGAADVVVCDGFVGNIVLKFAEGTLGLLKAKIKEFSTKGLSSKILALFTKITLKRALKDFDYQNYGGAPLLGVNGVVIIGHGRSSALAIKNMIFRAQEMLEKNINQKIQQHLEGI